MIAYDETYLSGAQRRLGDMLDFGVNGCGLELGSFFRMFAKSPLALRFEAGEPAVVAGKSGEELARDLLNAASEPPSLLDSWSPAASAPPEYWVGWALAFYQWASGFSFWAIEQRVPVDKVLTLYRPYHEMDIRQFCDKMDQLCVQAHPQTNLQAARIAAGLSQSQLAHAAGVPVRTLQQYEQRQKDINRARADYVESLARTLCCHPSDLLERKTASSIEYALVKL